MVQGNGKPSWTVIKIPQLSLLIGIPIFCSSAIFEDLIIKCLFFKNQIVLYLWIIEHFHCFQEAFNCFQEWTFIASHGYFWLFLFLQLWLTSGMIEYFFYSLGSSQISIIVYWCCSVGFYSCAMCEIILLDPYAFFKQRLTERIR